MPVELLQKLARRTLPLTVTDVESIDKLRVLHASGHVVVRLPPVVAKEQFACVLAITEHGRETLHKLKATEEVRPAQT